jgi:hypothetical protein
MPERSQHGKEHGKKEKESEHTESKSYTSNYTTDHEVIRKWAEERGAKPACVKGTGDKGDIGILRLDFPGYSGQESLTPISWDDWFSKFEERQLALVYQDETGKGVKSNFNKIISRETANEAVRKRHA